MKSEFAIVWKGGGRRWFSKVSAARGEARSIIRARCDCEKGSHEIDYSPEVCIYHESPDFYHHARNNLALIVLSRYDKGLEVSEKELNEKLDEIEQAYFNPHKTNETHATKA